MDWFDLLEIQGTLKSLLQHHSSKASILRRSAFFIVQLSHPHMTTGKNIALTRWTFVGKVMSLLLNMLSRLVITFLPRSKRLLISWLQSPSAVPPGNTQKNKTSENKTTNPSLIHHFGPQVLSLPFQSDLPWGTLPQPLPCTLAPSPSRKLPVYPPDRVPPHFSQSLLHHPACENSM